MKSRTRHFNSFLFISVMVIFTGNAFGQAATDTWTVKASFGGAGRRDAVGFAIGSKGYVGSGSTSSGPSVDFWEYDPATNAWTQKANLTGAGRAGALGFGIGSKGYVGGGVDASSNYLNDFYEFDPVANTWTAKAAVPGIGTEESVSFTIGSKGYYGTGFNGNTPPYCNGNFYEYTPLTDTWATKAGIPASGTRYGAIGFGIGSKGYLGSGSNCVTGDVNNFYEFDPTANTWTAKANFPGVVRESATSLSIGNRGYVANGRNAGTMYNDFYEYDPPTNTWTLRATPIGGLSYSSAAFGIGNKGYLATGYNFNNSGSAAFLNTMYEYSACPVNNQVVSPATATAVCSGAVNFTVASQTGVNYYLRNSSNTVLAGPVIGTGGTLTLPSGNVTTTSTFNILGKAASGALTFDGSNDRVSIPFAAQFNYGTTTDITFEAMINFTASQPNYAGIIAKANAGSPFTQLVIYNNKIAAEVFSSMGLIGVADGLLGTTTLNDGRWHQVAMVVSRSTNNVKLYVDGAVEASVTNAFVSGNLNDGVGINIGGERSATAFFAGSIDEARIWNTARSATQLTANASICLTGTEPGLQAYYNFENGLGSGTVTDIAGGDNNGTLTNMNNTSAWTYGVENCAGCSYQLATQPVITINNLSNQTVAAATASFCTSGSTTINSGGSEPGVNYYLNDNGTGTVVTGPIAGTGSALSFTTGTITSTKVYNVTAKKMSGGLTFDGVDDYVAAVTTASIQSLGLAPFTMEAWIYPTGLTGTRSIIRKDGDYNFYLNAGLLNAEVFPGGGSGGTYKRAAGTIALTANRWTHVASVWDGTAFTLYVDGLSVSTTTASSSSSNTSVLTLGASVPFGNPFAGKLDEVRIWNTLRSVSQLTTNITACLTGTETGLAAYYKFEDGIGSTKLTDFAGGDNNGTLTNMAVTTAWTTGVENCGCTLQMATTPTVTINAVPTVTVTSATICSGKSATLTPTGAGTYTITGGTFTVSPATSASYSVTGTSAAGCVSSNTAVSNVSVNITPTLTVNSATICSGASVTFTPAGASTYSITGSAFTVTPPATTSYSVTGTAANGCNGNTVVATVSVNITPTLTVNSPTICSGNSAVITPTGAATYSITGGAFTVSPGTPTSYSVTGTSAAGCVSSNTVVAAVAVNITPTLSVNNATICSGTAAVITPTGASTYSITGGAFTVSPSSTTSYSVTGTSAAGCVSSNTAVASVSVNITPTITVNNPTVCSGNPAVITSSGADTYSITGNTFTVTPSATTSYSVTGTATNGCTGNTAVATVSVNASPVISANDATICSGNPAVITPAGADTYSITGNAFTVTPSVTTSYSVTGTATNGCTGNTAIATVSVNTTPTVTVNDATICSGNSVVISPAGADTYTISGGSFTVTPASTASYSVTGTSADGCASFNTAVSTISVNLSPMVTASDATVCSGDAAVIVPGGADTYTITGGNFTVTPLSTASYSVTGTATNGCVSSNTAVATVSVNTGPSVTVTGDVICSGNSTVITPTGADTYTITGNSFTVSPSVTTSYSVTGTGANGCVSALAAVSTISVNASPTITVNNPAVCSGNPAVILPMGADTYTISGGSFTVTPSIPTSYTVTGTSVAGCAATNTVVSMVSLNTKPIVTVNSATVCSGSRVVIAPAGAVTYTISGNSFTVSPVSNSSYSVTGTDINGCVSDAVVSTVSVNPLPVVTASTSNATVCVNQSATLTAAGASTYSWSTGATATTSIVVTPSVAGSQTYTVTGTNAIGCSGTATVVETTALCTGIKENVEGTIFNVYPNPSTGTFVVETDENVLITVLNSLGQVVYKESTKGLKTTISMDNAANGVYFIQASCKGFQQTVKLIKN